VAASGEPEPQPVEADAGDSEKAVRWLRLVLVIAILLGGVVAAFSLREPLLTLLRNELLRSQTTAVPITTAKARHTTKSAPVRVQPAERAEKPTLVSTAQHSANRSLVPNAAAGPLSRADFTVAVRAREDAWLTVTADNRRIMYGLLPANETRQFHAAQKLVFVTGNAGGVEISFNGSSLGVLGGEGERKQVAFTPAGIQQ
jgi:cytoskeletal protein RodZ